MYVQLRHRSLPGFTKNISICVKKIKKCFTIWNDIRVSNDRTNIFKWTGYL